MITNVIPVPRYRDAPAAIEWLFGMCGFQKYLIVPHLDGTTRTRSSPLAAGYSCSDPLSETKRNSAV